MQKLKFKKTTDTAHKIELESTIISAVWATRVVFAGRKAVALVETSLVGWGAPIKLTVKDQEGSKLATLNGEVFRNRFRGAVDIPENAKLDDRVYFEVALKKQGLKGRSNVVPVRLPPKLKSIRWSTDEARRGDVVTLEAELEDVRDYAEAILTIYEYDQDGAHDRIVGIPVTVKDGKATCEWEYQYHEDTDEIPTRDEKEPHDRTYNPPEYFFTVTIEGIELADHQESGLLEFKDYVELAFADDSGAPIPNAEYTLTTADGEEREGKADENGYAREEDVPPGKVTVQIRNT